MLTKQEIRQLGNREMNDELQRTRRELLKMQFDIRSGTSKEVHMVKNFKRYIARLKTLAKEMKMEVNLKMGKAEAAPLVEAKEPKKETAPLSGAAPVKKTAAKKTAKAAKSPMVKSPAKAKK